MIIKNESDKEIHIHLPTQEEICLPANYIQVLRDEFAKAALRKIQFVDDAGMAARKAYEVADAMLSEREKK